MVSSYIYNNLTRDKPRIEDQTFVENVYRTLS